MYRLHSARGFRIGWLGMAALAAACLVGGAAAAEWRPQSPDRVLNLLENRNGPEALAADRGAAGLRQKLQKLTTTASALYTTAHPDDEQGGVLTYLSRKEGVRTSMLTLNRGESGANAIGSELFEGLGLIRTEELLVADRYYGLDDQYFTTMIDYGFSKSLDEALDQWGRENVLRDVVRVIRINRPLALIARFHGSERDGHGNHQTAGVITQEAFEAAGDPSRFPEQISGEGLRAWQPLKMYRSNLRPRFSFREMTPPTERWQVRVNPGEFSPWLGESYQNFSALGLSFQRSQNSGRRRETFGEYYQYFERFHTKIEGPEKETGFFEGIDTRVSGIFNLLGQEAPDGILPVLQDIEAAVADSLEAFSVANPAATVPFLTAGLAKTRQALAMSSGSPDAAFILKVKERQFMDAINTALGLQLSAVAVPVSTQENDNPFAPEPAMGVAVPGQKIQVNVTLSNGAPTPLQIKSIDLSTTTAWPSEGGLAGESVLDGGGVATTSFTATVPADAELGQRYFTRESVRASRYTIRDTRDLHLPRRHPVMTVAAVYQVGGQPVEIDGTVYRREANLPYGVELRELKVAPALVVNLSPEYVVVPLNAAKKSISVKVELINNNPDGSSGSLSLNVPDGWNVSPASVDFAFAQPGERSNHEFSVAISNLADKDYQIEAVARTEGGEYRQGYREIIHRDNETQYQYRPSSAVVRGIDVKIAPGLNVGYIMGVGDEVPSGIEQLGAKVTLLSAQDLAAGDFRRFDAIVVGTRAYAVRDDLITYNRSLLDYALAGGNLIILYETQEFVPNKWAAYPAELPPRAEEVSEEDSPVTVLAKDHVVFNWPNKIVPADFDNWVEQRGSKFFTEWDSHYVPMIETHDRGQEPQRGGWLVADYGKGHYTYFAYAVHRQVPYAVPGMYRIFANLLSLGKR